MANVANPKYQYGQTVVYLERVWPRQPALGTVVEFQTHKDVWGEDIQTRIVRRLGVINGREESHGGGTLYHVLVDTPRGRHLDLVLERDIEVKETSL